MKKLICALLAALVLHTAVFAAPQIVFNNELRTIDINGVSARKNAMISITVVKKGVEASDLTQSILFRKLSTDGNGVYSGQFLLPSEEEGTEGGFYYEVYISGDEACEEFYLATPSEIANCISAFDSPESSTISSAIRNNKDVLGVKIDSEYEKYSLWIEKSMLEFIAEEKAESLTEIIEYIDKAKEAAYLILGDKEKVNEALEENLLENTIDSAYDTELIAQMLLNVRAKPASGEDITDVLAKNLRIATAIVAVNSSTRGKMAEVLEEYNDVLLLDLDGDYASLTKSEVNIALVKKHFTSISQIKTAFENSVAELMDSSVIVSTPTSSSGRGAGGGAATYNPKSTPEPEISQDIKAPFTDLASVPWAEEAIDKLYQKGIITGYGNNDFAPEKTVTRAEFAKMIVSLAGDVTSNAAVGFSDVSESDWFAPYIEKAASAGLVSGMGSTFVPNGEITREDAALIIYRLIGANLNLAEVASFSDESNISDYAREAIKALAGSKIINGMGDGSFSPKTTLTRAQAAVLIYSAMGKLQ